MIDFKALAQKYDTPLYLYDFDHIKERYRRLKEAFRGRKSLICYAVKANSNLSVIRLLANEGAGCDCVSIGEVRRALLAGVPNYHIIFSGVGKRDDEIEEALEKEILMINLESEAELSRVEAIAAKLGKTARISIRVNPDIDPQTHPYISTGLSENKFGVSIDTAKRMYIGAKNSPHLEPVGIHFHIGSQLTQLQPIKEASAIVADLVRNLKALEIDLKFFDIGGGIGIRYSDEETIEPYDYAQAVLSTITGLDMTVMCEPGRYLVGNGGYFLTRVLYEKQNAGKRFVIVDGAMNDLIRPALYHAFHRIEVVGKTGEATPADVVGPVCESGDFFAKELPLPPTDHDDLLLLKSAGAYGFTMSSNYNTRPRAAEVAIENGEDRLIRRREKFEDLIAQEIDYLKER
ncbi:MAG: diaminopimelate decarboxylase [Campylobacteraceae bacterium 4484_4]|nr:MAG: diaminopimelate decarboxylase [Campylobacteraceae bacterium 4484_4]